MFDLNNSVTLQRGKVPSNFFESIGNKEVIKEKNRITHESHKRYTIIQPDDSKWAVAWKRVFECLPRIFSMIIERSLNYWVAPGEIKKWEKTLQDKGPTEGFINQTVKDVFRQTLKVNDQSLQELAWQTVKDQMPESHEPLVQKYLSEFKVLPSIMQVMSQPSPSNSDPQAYMRAQEIAKAAVEKHVANKILPDLFNTLKSKVGYINADKGFDLLSQTFNNHVYVVLEKKYSEKLPGMPINCNWQEEEGISRGETILNTATNTLSFNENYRVGTSTGQKSIARACINVNITVDLTTFNAQIKIKVSPAKDISPEEAHMMNKAWKTSFRPSISPATGG